MWPLAVVDPDLELRGEGGFACPAGFSFLLLLFITQNEEGEGVETSLDPSLFANVYTFP